MPARASADYSSHHVVCIGRPSMCFWSLCITNASTVMATSPHSGWGMSADKSCCATNGFRAIAHDLMTLGAHADARPRRVSCSASYGILDSGGAGRACFLCAATAMKWRQGQFAGPASRGKKVAQVAALRDQAWPQPQGSTSSATARQKPADVWSECMDSRLINPRGHSILRATFYLHVCASL